MTPETQKRLMGVRARLMAAISDELDAGRITAAELLSLLAHTTGACIAWQDQRRLTPDQAMEMVATNIEAGNREAMAEILSAGGKPS